MDRKDICGKNLHELDLEGLAELCGNVARHSSADYRQSQTAHVLRVEWLRLNLGSLNGDKTDAEKYLKKRMEEFLAGVPNWMLSGISTQRLVQSADSAGSGIRHILTVCDFV